MQFENGRFITETAADLLALGKFLGSYAAISLQSPLKDINGNLLVQAHRPLTEKFVSALRERERSSELNTLYELENSENLKNSVAEKLGRHLQQKLNTIEFSFIEQIFGKKNFPLQTVLKTALKNDFFMAQMLVALRKKEAVLEHSIEITLYALVLLLQALEESSLSLLTVMLQAALLHDMAIKDIHNWQWEDSFEEEPQEEHDRLTSSDIPDHELYQKIAPIINGHNHLADTAVEDHSNWQGLEPKLMHYVLNLVEFFFYCKRKFSGSAGEGKSETAQIFYKIAYHAEKGAFPQSLVSLLESHHRKYSSVFAYAKKIAQIENSCPHNNLAVAYPKPKVTQVLCRDNTPECKFRQVSQPINIIQNDKEIQLRLGVPLNKGWHSKCVLGEQIPKAPPEL